MIRHRSLDGGWEFSQKEWLAEPSFGYSRVPGWLPAEVPGHVHMDLVHNGVIRHPFEAVAELGCHWVDEVDWAYRTRFHWSPEPMLPHRMLRFEGLDTVCTICLNGREIGSHDNMFLPLEIDVSGLLVEGENELRIDFESAARVGRRRRADYFAKEGLADHVANFEERAFVRKAQYMFGWDWGPRLVSCGIWKSVQLVESRVGIPESAPRGQPKVELRREPDQWGESFEFVVDGQPLWAMGANWIPCHSFPSQTSQLRSLLEPARAMKMNMLRVWGGGLYESDEFYDLCDELEIFVWQDFPFACSYYPDDDEFVEKIRQEATYHVKRLRHHPCLAIWCGNNENLTMWQGKWGGAEHQPPRFHGERIWNEVLKEVVEKEDPGRPYIPTSPIGSPPGIQDCNAGGFGDQHYWDVWHGRGDWIHYADSQARFCSEFGFPSACGQEAWKSVLGKAPRSSNINPQSPAVRWHDKTGRPYDYWRELITKHYPEPMDLDELIYYSQLNQRDAMRCAIEHYRRSEFCKGSLIWQINDVWPVQSWSLIDSEGRWKAAAHELQRLYSPTLSCLKSTDDRLEVWLINDTDEVQDEFIQLGVYDSLTGSRLYLGERTDVSLRPHSRGVYQTHDLTPYDRRQVIVNLFSYSGEPNYLLCEPKDLRLSQPTIKAWLTEQYLEICPNIPVIDLHVEDPTGSSRIGALIEGTGAWNFETFESPCPWRYTFEGEVRALRGRSLAGVHEIEIISEPATDKSPRTKSCR